MKVQDCFNISRVLKLGLICIFLVSSACATKPDKASLESGEYIDDVIRGMVKPDQPGIAVLISRGDRVLLSKGYGLADMEQEIPVTSKTKFRIGSITKQFTAASILKLQEEGKLKVTDRLSKYLPGYPRGDEVTLHHLLTHTSGIENYTDKIDFSGRVTQGITPEDLIETFKYEDFNFNPGDSYSYSNSGYFLLGYILERVSGKSYEKYLQETFFKPLAMNDSGVHHADLKLANEALGYSHIEGETVNALNWDMSHAGAAGAIYSTVEDLHRWNEGIFKG
ncbi:MAG: beta-lactamase family protein, partial [Gammaproteobacteria bacterium]|nr:beta-lactamase family protein [Gammaproteobacteria bacterium]